MPVHSIIHTREFMNFLDEDEFVRWILNARKTLESSRIDLNSAFYNWSCFKSQQAAEYAVKAYLRGTGQDSFGHSVSSLAGKAQFNANFINFGKTLDKYYIPTRYTDAWVEGIPGDYYTVEEAIEAIEDAEAIIQEVESNWKLLKEEEQKGNR